MVNDIEAKHPQTNNLVKFADDLTVSVPVTSSGDSALNFPLSELTKLFDSLILSLFYYAIEVWGSALQAKYIDKFSKFLNRAFRYGYTQNKYSMAKMIEERDRLFFNK
ncbi:Hypothetical predicted protein, partial [Paramuricea clavata]